MKSLVLIKLFLATLTLGQFAVGQTVQFESAVRVKKSSDSAFQEVPIDQSIQLNDGENALVMTKHGLPLLIYSSKSSRSDLKVSDTNLSQILQEHLTPTLNKALNEVMDGIRKTEMQIQKRDYSQAEYTITDLKKKYPQIAEILFLSATVQYLNKNKAAAIQDLTKGLEINPKDSSAQKLLAELKGDRK